MERIEPAYIEVAQPPAQQSELALLAFGPQPKSANHCLGDIRGLLQHLRSRPMPEGRHVRRWERDLLVVLTDMVTWGEALVDQQLQGTTDPLQLELEEQGYADAHFAAMQDGFALLEELDERVVV